MPNGFLTQVPDLSGLLSSAGNLQGGIGGLTNTFASLSDGGEDSPAAAVANAFAGLDDQLDIDLSGLTEQLPGAVEAIRNALPANTIRFVESLGDAYTTAQGFLQDSQLVQQIGQGGSLQDAALAVVADAFTLFDDRLNELTANLIDADSLDRVRTAAAAIEQFRNDFPANQADFLPFLADYLLGVGPAVLDDALGHVEGFLALRAPLEPEALSASLAPIRTQLSDASTALVTAIESFDPSDANAYLQIQLHLDQIEAASNLLFTALSALYQQLQSLIESKAWDTFFATYVSLLDAIDIGEVAILDDFVDAALEMLEDMLARALTAFGAEDLRDRLALVTQNMRDAVLGSPLAQIRPALQGFLGEIEQAIEDVPTEAVQEAVEDILGRIQAELANLNLGSIETEIKAAFESVDDFIQANFNDTLRTAVLDSMNALAGQVDRLPLASILNQLTTAIAQIQVLADDLEAAIGSELDSLENLLSQLETLSFKPVSDEVIAEIDDLKARLQAINPDALSDAEKLAIGAALAVLEAIDLDGKVVAVLKDGYNEVEVGIKRILDQVVAALNQLKERIGGFSPNVLLEPAAGLFDEAADQVDRLNGQALLAPLYDQLKELTDQLSSLSPGQLLAPLQEPYDTVFASVHRIDPSTWVAPLHDLHSEIGRLVDLIDVTPLLDELDQRQRALFESLRSNILAALDALDLPEPFATFFAQIRPIIELMTDALFGDPDTALRDLNVEFQARVDLKALFAPLDAAFQELIELIETLPEGDLTSAMNALRQSLGAGLEALNPQAIIGQLRNGYGRLAELAPTHLLGTTLNLPALKLAFEARAAEAPADRQPDALSVSARFEAVISATTPQLETGQMQRLIREHHAAKEALRLRINQLDDSSASQSYARLRRSLDRLLPEFLRQPDPLTHADIIAGIHAMRPSAKAGLFEDAISRLLQQTEPLQSAIEPAFNDFFALLREIMVIINPLAIRDDIEAIYDTLREKLEILDPEALSAAIDPLWANLTAPLNAINPAQLAARIDASFRNAVDALAGPLKLVLDELAALIDDQLRAIRAAVLDLLDQVESALSGSLGSVDAVLKRIEDLIFVGILERLCRVIDNLGLSFEAELDRVQNAFNAMLAAIPIRAGVSASVSSAA